MIACSPVKGAHRQSPHTAVVSNPASASWPRTVLFIPEGQQLVVVQALATALDARAAAQQDPARIELVDLEPLGQHAMGGAPTSGLGPAPPDPGAGGGVAGLEGQDGVVPAAPAQVVQGALPLGVGDVLGGVAGEDHQVEALMPPVFQGSAVALHPGHSGRTGPPAGVVEHRRRGIRADDAPAGRGQGDGEQPGAASQVEDVAGGDPVGQGSVEIVVGAVGVVLVVEVDDARIVVRRARAVGAPEGAGGRGHHCGLPGGRGSGQGRRSRQGNGPP